MIDGSARRRRRRLAAWGLASAVLLGGSVAVAVAAKKGRGQGAERSDQPAEPEPYLRVDRSEAPELRLEVAVRRFEPAGEDDGPAIWLAAVTHLGERGYYEALQEHLDARGLVLYEGVGLPGFLQRGGAEDTAVDRARRTRAGLRYVAARLHGYRNRHGSFPASLDLLHQELTGRSGRAAWWLKAAMTDGWGHRLRYEAEGDGFTLMSHGRDGEPGGEGPDAEVRFADQPPLTEGELNPRAPIQADLAEALGLVFQFDGVDYDRPHFRHSDLSMTAMRQALAGHPPATPATSEPATSKPAASEPDSAGSPRDAETPDPDRSSRGTTATENGSPHGGSDGSRPATAGQQQFRKVARLLDGSSLAASVLKFAMNVIDSSPRLRAITRLLLIEMLGQLEGDLAQARGLPKGVRQLLKVLIHQRNRAVVADLERALGRDEPPGSISVLYGAGHMPDLENRLRDRLGYEPAGQRWLTAFSVDRDATGLTETELKLLRSMIRVQMKALGR